MLQNAGTEGELYLDYKHFTPIELRKYLRAYIMYGLLYSSEKREDDINGISYVKCCLGPTSIRIHKRFNMF